MALDGAALRTTCRGHDGGGVVGGVGGGVGGVGGGVGGVEMKHSASLLSPLARHHLCMKRLQWLRSDFRATRMNQKKDEDMKKKWFFFSIFSIVERFPDPFFWIDFKDYYRFFFNEA